MLDGDYMTCVPSRDRKSRFSSFRVQMTKIPLWCFTRLQVPDEPETSPDGFKRHFYVLCDLSFILGGPGQN